MTAMSGDAGDLGDNPTPSPASTPKNKDLADSTPGLTLRFPDSPITGLPDLFPAPSPHASTRIPKHLRDASQIGVGFRGFSLSILAIPAILAILAIFLPSPSWVSQIGVDFRAGHPKPSQIGVGLTHYGLIGVGLSNFGVGLDLAKS
jgi:hypothetical protein